MTQRKEHKTLFLEYSDARRLAQEAISPYLPGLAQALDKHFADLSPISVRSIFEQYFNDYNKHAKRVVTYEPAEGAVLGVIGMKNLPDDERGGFPPAVIERMVRDSVLRFERMAKEKLEIALFELIGEVAAWAHYRELVQTGRHLGEKPGKILEVAKSAIIQRNRFEQAFLRRGVERLHGDEFWSDTAKDAVSVDEPVESDLAAAAKVVVSGQVLHTYNREEVFQRFHLMLSKMMVFSETEEDEKQEALNQLAADAVESFDAHLEADLQEVLAIIVYTRALLAVQTYAEKVAISATDSERREIASAARSARPQYSSYADVIQKIVKRWTDSFKPHLRAQGRTPKPKSDAALEREQKQQAMRKRVYAAMQQTSPNASAAEIALAMGIGPQATPQSRARMLRRELESHRLKLDDLKRGYRRKRTAKS